MNGRPVIERKLSRFDLWFVAATAIAYMVAAFLMPSYVALIEPDSSEYTEFRPNRTVLYPGFIYFSKMVGLDFTQMTWVQILIFGLALAYLLVVLMRADFPKMLLFLLVVALAGNVLFTSFHKSILTESIFFSLVVVATGLWTDYFRTGRIFLLGVAGLVVGLMIGVRPVGLAIVPMQLLAVLVRRSPSVPKWVLLLVAFVPVGLAVGGERLLYRVIHKAPAQSTAPLLYMGKAALLIRPGMTFDGPHAEVLNRLGTDLLKVYTPIQKMMANSPSLWVRLLLNAPYEGNAQAQAFLIDELNAAAAESRSTVDELRTELGKQVILQNIPGYVVQTLLTQIGQWMVDAQRFPPNARAIAAYADTSPAIDLDGKLTKEMLYPKPSAIALIVYPSFLIAGVVTLFLAIGVVAFIVRPALMEGAAGFYLGIAVFFSVLCHGYTLFISLANVWTPRFLMAVFPQLEIIALCLVVTAAAYWRGTRRA